jgi:diguanylate cyclase (GGDEF)-like protein/PAS domain S-box-containing protein
MRSNDAGGKAGTELTGLLDKLPEGVAVVDAKRVVRFANRAAGTLLDPAAKGIEGTVFEPPIVPGETTTAQIHRWAGVVSLVEMHAIEITWEGERAFLVLMRDVTELRRAERELREERDFSTSLVQSSPAFFVAVAPEGKILMMNEAMTRSLGYPLDEVLGQDYLRTMVQESDRESLSALFDEMLHQEKTAVTVGRVVAKDGKVLDVEWHVRPVLRKEGEVHYFFNMGIDITERRKAELLLRESEERYRSLLEASSEGIVILSGTEILDLNGALEVMTGAKRRDLVGRDVLGLLAGESWEAVRRALVSGQAEATEAVCVRRDGARINVQVMGKPHTYRGRAVTVMILRDITELASLRERLLSLSHLDELTGLSNRRGFQFLAYQQMKLANRSRKGLLLIFLDLDDMKRINDTLGHRAGDMALVETAGILRETMRKSDIVARIGGDEFVVMAIEAQPGSETVILERLRGVLERVNADSTRGYDLSFSYGTAYYNPEAPSSLEALMGEADELMYAEKRRKKSRRP